jgi:hypothetical protein
VKDLVLADHDGIEAHGDPDHVTDHSLVDEEPAPRGQVTAINSRMVSDDGVGLDAMARLEDESGHVIAPTAGLNAETLTLNRRDVPRVGHERDKASGFTGHHGTAPG